MANFAENLAMIRHQTLNFDNGTFLVLSLTSRSPRPPTLFANHVSGRSTSAAVQAFGKASTLSVTRLARFEMVSILANQESVNVR